MSLIAIVFLLVGTSIEDCLGAGLTTHVEVGERAAEFLGILSEGVDYLELVRKHPDAFQAGCPYPDAYWPDICFDGAYYEVSRTTHGTLFLNTSINYIRNTYPRPWSEDAEKLVVFLFGIVCHLVADQNWHSLGIDQGFLDVMGNINYHGSFDDAHRHGDIGSDVLNVFQLDTDYIGEVGPWYIPIDDLLNMYEDHYGEPGRIDADAIINCTNQMYIAIFGENIGIFEILYPFFANASPFITDRLQDYYLGGVDDMAVWTHNVWQNVVTMLDQGTEVCDWHPDYPIYIDCKNNSAAALRELQAKPEGSPVRRASLGAASLSKIRKEAINKSNIGPEDIVVEWTDRGFYMSPSQELKKRFEKLRMMKKEEDEEYRSEALSENDELMTMVTSHYSYESDSPYSRLGEEVLQADFNNDGLVDLIISAPGFSEPGKHQMGRVYIVYSSLEGLPPVNGTIDDVASVTLNGLRANGRFGTSLAYLDLNVDGFFDLVVSAPNVGSPELQYSGEVYVYFGSRLGAISTSPNVTISCKERYCNMGKTLAVGDVNNDNHDDLIIGSPMAPGGGEQRGEVSALLGSAAIIDGRIYTEDELDCRWSGDQNYDWFGYSVAVATARSGDKFLIIGAPSHRICAVEDCRYDERDVQAVGQVTIIALSEEELCGLPSPVLVLEGKEEFEQLGFTVASGLYSARPVLAIVSSLNSEFHDNSNLTQPGIVSLYALEGSAPVNQSFATFVGSKSFSRFGSKIHFRDVNSDNIEDMLISAPHWSETYLNAESGRLYLAWGNIDNEDTTVEDFMQGDIKSRFGSSVTSLRNPPNKLTMAAGAPHSNIGARLGGKVDIFEIIV